MIKIILIIFIIIPIYYSNECDGKAESKDKCFEKIIDKKYTDFCCYFEELDDPTKGRCKTVPYASYYTGYNREYIDGKLYSVSCKSTDIRKYALEQCGNIHKNGEASLKNCKEYSTFVDSCCYFSGDYDETIDQGEQKLVKGCYWLGSKYEGKITWAGAKLECNNNYLNYSLFYFFSFAFSIIMLF